MVPLATRPLRALVMKSGRPVSPTRLAMLAGPSETARTSTAKIRVVWLPAASTALTRKVVWPLPKPAKSASVNA